MTPPERRLWSVLKEKPQGLKFRRQHPMGAYILDFFCHGPAIAVEVDGLAHELGANPERDRRRDEWIARQGIRTLRYAAIDIRDNLEAVATAIIAECVGRSPRKSPPPPSAVPLPCEGRGG